MKDVLLRKALPVGLALIAGVVLALWWLGIGMRRDLKERVPGTDRALAGSSALGGTAKWEGRLIKSNGVPADLPGVWPSFRGPNRDGISPETVPLAKSWGPNGPRVFWTIDVGEGYAGPTVWKGRVYVMDYDHQAKADALRCLSLADGKEIWRYTYPVRVKRNHGMSRTVPAITDKYVVAMGPKCQVTCLDSLTGEFHWTMNLVREFNTEVPDWYAGQCPLMDGDRAILAPGGDNLMVAVDCASGKVAWKSPNPNGWQMTHSSIVATEFKGQKMYLYCASAGVVGISARDGAILWQTPDWKISLANVPSPVPIGDGRVFLCGGYEAGSLMLRMTEANSQLCVENLFRLKPAVFGAVQHTPILYQQHLFGMRAPDGQLVCLDLDGKLVWKSGSQHKFGGGPLLLAQGLIFALSESGVLSLVEASTTGYKELAQAKVLPGPDAWGPMALAGGRLIVRDMFKMACLDVAAK